MEKQLLIVEDNAEMASTLSEFLSDLVDNTKIASTVDEAQDLLLCGNFSLIILDINLRGRNGSEVIKFLKDNPENPNSNTPIIIVSGLATPQFIEKNKDRFAGVLPKPFQINELLDAATIALNPKTEIEVVQKPEIELQSFEVVPFLKCKIPLSGAQLEERVTSALTIVKNYATAKSILNAIKIDRAPENYYQAHNTVLINVLLAFAIQLEWNTEKTLQKLIYAAYLHDMALIDRPHLAKIQTMEQLESMKQNLNDHEYRLVFEHPNIAATTMSGVENVDEDILTILRQHHELPAENGFPAKLSHKKIIPMSALFIIAHDVTSYILETPKWSLKTYLPTLKAKYNGLVFLKILASLAEIKL